MTDDATGTADDDQGVEYGLDDWSSDAGDADVANSDAVTGAATTADRFDGGVNATRSVAAGAAVAFVLSQLFPVIGVALGGALAGNLHGRGSGEGAKLGAAAGLLQTVPDLLLGLVFGIGGLSGFLFPVVTGQVSTVDAAFALVFAGLIAAVYLVLGAVAGGFGGYVGGRVDPILDQVGIQR